VILIGVVLGFSVDVFLVHPVINGGERNLWPFEIAVFVACGFLPCGAGVWIGSSVFEHRVSAP
jgi:hypothetical protein